jgi:hypothetical protein
VFRMDVAKVDQDVAYFASVSETCCKCFQRHVASVCLKYFIFFRLMLHVFLFEYSTCFTPTL